MTIFECEDLTRLILSFLISENNFDDIISIYNPKSINTHKPHKKINCNTSDISNLIFINKMFHNHVLEILSEIDFKDLVSYLTKRTTMPTTYSQLPSINDCQYEETIRYCSYGYITNNEYYEDTDELILKDRSLACKFICNYITIHNYKIVKKNNHYFENNLVSLVNDRANKLSIDDLYNKIRKINLTVNFIKILETRISNCRNDDYSSYYKLYNYNIGNYKINLVHSTTSTVCSRAHIILYCDKSPIFFHGHVDSVYGYGNIVKKKYIRDTMSDFGFKKINEHTYYHFVEILLLIIFRQYEVNELPCLIRNTIVNGIDIKNRFVRHLKY